MRVLVTGASGFVGSTLAAQLVERGEVGGRRIVSLALADREPVAGAATSIAGDLADAAVLRSVCDFAPDIVFHLAAMPGGAAEADYAAGRRVNLDASLALFEALATSGKCPTVVYASSIAVYGADLPDPVTSATPLHPALTYGAHKQVCEILLADFTRRRMLDGRSVRLPGIVARPGSGVGLVSAFMSNILYALRDGERFTCPVGPEATAWWMSARCCAQNLLHAAAMDVVGADATRAWPLPVLRLSISQVVEAGARVWGANRRDLLDYAPQPGVERVFGRLPNLDDAVSRAFGFQDDGSADKLVKRAVGEAA